MPTRELAALSLAVVLTWALPRVSPRLSDRLLCPRHPIRLQPLPDGPSGQRRLLRDPRGVRIVLHGPWVGRGEVVVFLHTAPVSCAGTHDGVASTAPVSTGCGTIRVLCLGPRTESRHDWGSRFEFCTYRCRVHARSTAHENDYIERSHKHCFSKARPCLLLPPRCPGRRAHDSARLPRFPSAGCSAARPSGERPGVPSGGAGCEGRRGQGVSGSVREPHVLSPGHGLRQHLQRAVAAL